MDPKLGIDLAEMLVPFSLSLCLSLCLRCECFPSIPDSESFIPKSCAIRSKESIRAFRGRCS
uniref:Uncharacterized protein n=2 Tax=Picea TaxID=3328 RepID=A0A117NGH4_PICGL|nr:hypothetical protein ABT39_MTgene6246 [Picea glauca]QHR92627.1 hypothetical protein Q903MT_gene6674 [Picea sitchensis]